MSRILIAIGGSGQEIALACLRLCHMTSLAVPRTLVVDSDTLENAGGSKTRTDHLGELSQLFQRYGRGHLVTFVAPYDRDQVRTGVTDLFSRFGQPADQTADLLDMLLSKKQQATSIIDGFHGEPTVGAIAFADALGSDVFKQSLSMIDQATESTKEHHYIVIAGGTGGGTGPGVLPVMADHLAQWRKQLPAERRARIEISLLLVSPWFQMVDRKSGDIDLPAMQHNSACLVRYYFEELLQKADRILLLSLPKEIARQSDGPNRQHETEHYLNVVVGWLATELLAASALIEKTARGQMYGFAFEESSDLLKTLEFTPDRGHPYAATPGERLPLGAAVDAMAVAAHAAEVLAEQLSYAGEVALPKEIWVLATLLGGQRKDFCEVLLDLAHTDQAMLEWLVRSCGLAGANSADRDFRDSATIFRMNRDSLGPRQSIARLGLPLAGQNLVARLLKKDVLQAVKKLSAEQGAALCYDAVRSAPDLWRHNGRRG